MDIFLWILFLVVAVPVGVSYIRRAARLAELREPATRGDICAGVEKVHGVEKVLTTSGPATTLTG